MRVWQMVLGGAFVGLAIFVVGSVIYVATENVPQGWILLELSQPFLLFGIPLMLIGALIGRLIGKSQTSERK